MDTEGMAGSVFIMVAFIVLIANIFVIRDQFLFMFVFIILASGMILSSISKVLDKLSTIEGEIKNLLYEEKEL